MKKILMILVLLFLLGNALASETISSLQTNTPVAIDTPLIVTGLYLNTDTNNAVYCKFESVDDSNIVFDRLSDELIFSDDTFYTEKVLHEPLYDRDSHYTMRVTCGEIYSESSFYVDQRESPDNILFGELFYLRDNGFILIIIVVSLALTCVFIGTAWLLLKGAWRG